MNTANDSTDPDESGLGSRDVLTALRRRIGLIALCVLVTAGAALGFSVLQEEQYTAEASLLFRDPGFDQRLFGGSVFQVEDETREAATNVELVSLEVVADRTAEDLAGALDGGDLQDRIEIEEEGQSDVVTIAATDPSPRFATELANAFARNFIEFRRDADQAKIETAIGLVEGEIANLDPVEQSGAEGRSLRDQVSQLKTLEAIQTGNAELVQPATRPDVPSRPNTARNTALGLLLGLILGVGLALLFERLDRRVRDAGELEDLFELPVLGTVPESERLATNPEGVAEPLPFAEAEAFRMLRTRLRYFNVDRDVRSVVITSALPGEGKSTVAWNLALTAASSGVKALVVEADLHNQVFAREAGLAPLPGLAEVITKQSPIENAIQHVSVPDGSNGSGPVRTLDVLVAGATPPNPAELLESEEMAKLLDDATSAYDFVVLDTPPASVLADAIPLMSRASGVIVVSRIGQATRDDVTHLRGQLLKLDAPSLGVVANRVSAKGARYGYGYYGAHGPEASMPSIGVGSPD
jgi:receptor protein-tyrosine kinase